VIVNSRLVQKMSFLDFIRDIGKHITVNYMLAKDSVKNPDLEKIEGIWFKFIASRWFPRLQILFSLEKET